MASMTTRQNYSVTVAICLSLFAMLLTPVPVLAQWSVSGDAELVIRGGWLFDSVSDTRRRNTGIVIRNGKIVAVDANAQQQVPGAANVIELQDSDTILPGMIDLHAHYNFDLLDNGRVEEVVYNGIVFLANGVTSTWSAGEFYPERVIAQRNLIDAGESTGPRLFASGPYKFARKWISGLSKALLASRSSRHRPAK